MRAIINYLQHGVQMFGDDFGGYRFQHGGRVVGAVVRANLARPRLDAGKQWHWRTRCVAGLPRRLRLGGCITDGVGVAGWLLLGLFRLFLLLRLHRLAGGAALNWRRLIVVVGHIHRGELPSLLHEPNLL